MPLERKCGECRACCGPALNIDDPELKKPVGKSCLNLKSNGCAIYKDRPKICRAFKCGWLQEIVHINARPDKSGLLVYGMNTKFGFAYGIKELWPDARLSGHSQSLIDNLVETCLCVIMRTDGKRTATGPDRSLLARIAMLTTGQLG